MAWVCNAFRFVDLFEPLDAALSVSCQHLVELNLCGGSVGSCSGGVVVDRRDHGVWRTG